MTINIEADSNESMANSNNEQQETVLTEVAPERALARLDIEDSWEDFSGTRPCPTELWKPLLGNEKLTDELWNKLLVNSGDSILIKGSTVETMLFGGYVFDTSTGEASKNLRSDIDFETDDPEIMDRARKLSNKQGNVAIKAEVDGIGIDVADQRMLRKILVNGMQELHLNALNAAGQSQQEYFSTKDERRKHELAQKYEFTRFIAQNAQVDATRIQEADGMTLAAFNTFSRQEALFLEMKRTETGELEATIVDPIGSFEQAPEMDRNITELLSRTKPVQRQKKDQIEKEMISGFEFRNLNPIGVYRSMIEAGAVLDHMEFTNISLPYYTNASIGRLIRADCESNIRINGEPDLKRDPYSGGTIVGPEYQEYLDIHEYARKLNNGENLYQINHADGTPNAEETQRLQEITTLKLQEEIARAAFSNPSKALIYAFAQLPLGNFVDREVAKDFEEMATNKTKFPPNNTITMFLDEMNPHVNQLTEEMNTPATRTLVNINNIAKEYYGAEVVELKAVSGQSDEKKFHTEIFSKPPENMSEVFALLLVANERTSNDIDREHLKNIVSNWKPTGKLGLTWKKRDDAEFDCGVSEDEILRQMKKLEEFLEKN